MGRAPNGRMLTLSGLCECLLGPGSGGPLLTICTPRSLILLSLYLDLCMGLGILIKDLCLHFWLMTVNKRNDYLNLFLLKGTVGIGYIWRKHMQWSVLQLNSTHRSSGHEHSSQMTPFLQLVLFYLIFTPSDC